VNFLPSTFYLFSQIISYAEGCGSDSSPMKTEHVEHEEFVNINNRNDAKCVDKFALSVEEDEAEPTEYELERQRNIEERKKLLW
jgi:hypothetical protein